MPSLLKTIEAHLLGSVPLRRLVGDRVFGTQVPDRQPLPYVRLERAGTEYERFSTARLDKTAVAVSCYGTLAEEAEAVGRAVADQLDALFQSVPPARTVDCRPTGDATQAEPERGKDGLFRYVVPLEYRVVVSHPNRKT